MNSSNTPPTREDVEQFLQSFKRKIESGQYVFLNRPENSTDSLLSIGFSPTNRRTVLLELTVDDYSEGPGVDDATGNPLWVFGHRFKKKNKIKELYIKMHIGAEGKSAICVSFHEAKYEMSYPLCTSTKTV